MLIQTLRPGRDESVRRRHPWLFSGAVRRHEGDASDGLAEVRSSEGEVLAHGLACPGSPIEAKLWAFGAEEFNPALMARRFAAALAHRIAVVPPDTTGYRLLNSEGDHVPGLIADRYGEIDVLVMTAEGAVRRSEEITAVYSAAFRPGRLLVRTEADRPDRSPPGHSDRVPFTEYGLRFFADLASGQKTGFFLDQRENRRSIRRFAAGKSVLNLFSYSGGFSVAALAGGALRALDVDSSAAALELARAHRSANGFEAADEDFVEADVFADLRRRTSSGERFDIVICDPPAFAKRKADVEAAARGYKDVVRLAMSLVSPGGLLLACSCSGHVSPDLFQKILFAAAVDSKTSFSIFQKAGAGPDHPVSIFCPETEYLKAFFLRKE
jgi:23S rRNA (cytosine1962-C5)-methyltransferase